VSNDVVAVQIANAILEGEAVDWAAAQCGADAGAGPLLTSLQLLDRVAAAAPVRPQAASATKRGLGRSQVWLLVTSAAVVLGVVALLTVPRVSVRELVSQSGAAVLLPLTGAVLALSLARQLVVADQHVLRAGKDRGEELAALCAALRAARSVPEIAEHLDSGLQRILQLTSARAFLRQDSGEGYRPVRGDSGSLPGTAAIAHLLKTDHTCLPVGPRQPGTMFHLLPAAERAWVEQTSVASMVPLAGSYDIRIGFIALGAKRRGTSALSRQDASFLCAAAAAAALAIELRRQSAALGAGACEDGQPASECLGCGSIEDADLDRCQCGSVRRIAAVPRLVGGRFKVSRRLGRGSMGVVYAGRDIALGRPVALKTLTTLRAPAAERLRHEARMMAAVVHPNLATIFGLECWRSTPVLIVELLERGTLAARLGNGPLPVAPVLQIGVALAGALDQLHTAGVLHRDVKPSNLAFTAGDVPKLLDFGLASFVSADPSQRTATDWDGPLTMNLGPGLVAGTPLYLPPEAIAGGEPEASWDLWALSLVLYEAIAGRHPFAAPSIAQVAANISRAQVPDIRLFRPDCPDAIATAFASLLDEQRPRTASELQDRLQELARQAREAIDRV
jgi:hypothetical protein